MKKVVYNKFTKLFEMLCIIVAVGILLCEGIELAHWHKERDDACDKIFDEVMDYSEMSMIMYEEIAPYVDELILAYKDGGMQGLADEVAYDNEKWEKIHVTAADSIMYYNKGIEPGAINDWYYYVSEEDRITQAYYEVENEMYYYFNNSAGCTILVDDKVTGYLFDDYEYSGDTVDFNEVLSESSREYLKSIDYELHLFVCSSYSYASEIEAQYWSKYYDKVDEMNFGDIEDQILERIPTIVGCGVAIMIASVLLIISCGRKPEEKKELNYYERGYSEIHVSIAGALLFSLCLGVFAFYVQYHQSPFEIGSTELNLIDKGFVALVLLGVVWLYYELGIIIKKLINKRFIKDWLIARMIIKIKRWLVKKVKGITGTLRANYNASAYAALPELKRTYIMKVTADIVVGLSAFIMLIFVLTLDSNDAAWTLWVLAWIFVIFYFIKSFMEYAHLRKENRITEAVDKIYQGNYNNVEIDENETSETMKKLANLSDSFEESVRKQVEAEKMQIDLVANVSHDLKTPLTSIISYVDLLKEEEMSDVAKDYVKVLVDKSARLKEIVADVFDLAKATSGEQVLMEQLDGVVLINQVLSDMNDRIEEAGKDLRAKIQVEAVAIRGNGQKLYRVFQNVIDNALKYSMPGTRIYLNAESCNDEFVVTVKNVSEFEINYTAEEIMSRFTRGDKSRHSEGNGLGLSIAKSFTELCGGSFEVKLDDDIFMVIIRLR